MITTAATRATRSPELTPAQLAALKPHVISLTDGRLAREAVPEPQTVQDFATVEADIDEIFATHLPAFAAEHDLATVPIVLYAHGGLVDKDAGFATAQQQVGWWKANGVYPIHFVWETGLWTSIWDAIGRWAFGGSRGIIDDLKDAAVEKAARVLGGEAVWLDMKLDAAASSDPSGGARLLVRKLAAWMKANPDAATVHAVGHSAGSIFHSHLIPVALDAGVPKFHTVSLLAPAVRMDTFKELLLPRAADIGKLAIFTMTDRAERDDTCLGFYGKSLLYLVSASFESKPWTPILRLSKDISGDADVKGFLEGPGGDLIHSPNTKPLPSSSRATRHGDFDDDAATMESVLVRVTGTTGVTVLFPVEARAIELTAAAAALDRGRAAGGKSALCIGIDGYEKPGDRLRGCVSDAQLWQEVFTGAGFRVELLTNSDATRAGILGSIFQLLSGAAAGDTLVIQYSGHGTFAPDIEGGDEEDGQDEAICPVDFRSGRLVLDDDLAQLWDLIPDGASLTIFFDSCHSGGANRAGLPVDSLPRSVQLDAADIAAFRVARGVAAPAGRNRAWDAIEQSEPERGSGAADNPATAGLGAGSRSGAGSRTNAGPSSAFGPVAQREVLFAACTPTQFAWETNGQGDFTRTVAPLVAARIGSVTNAGFYEEIVSAFDAHRQNPTFAGSDAVAASPFLAPALAPSAAADLAPDLAALASGLAGRTDVGAADAAHTSGASARDAAIAKILRGIAELLES
ncbi:MAG: caspase family protein [Leucobacter sp.]